jgi:hypothetical protein
MKKPEFSENPVFLIETQLYFIQQFIVDFIQGGKTQAEQAQ